VIRSFADRTTADIFDGINSQAARKVPKELHEKARRLLDQINAAPTVDFLRTPPGNRLEKLRGNLAGFWSIRVNDQWRIVFRWKERDAAGVRILDYH